MLCNVMLSYHLVKLGVLFPDITLTNCWKVRAEVELENLESDIYRTSTIYLQIIYRVSTKYLQGIYRVQSNRTLDG